MTDGIMCKRIRLVQRRFPHLPYDGFSELKFDSEQAALKIPEGRALLAELPNFVPKFKPLVVKEHLIL